MPHHLVLYLRLDRAHRLECGTENVRDNVLGAVARLSPQVSDGHCTSLFPSESEAFRNEQLESLAVTL